MSQRFTTAILPPLDPAQERFLRDGDWTRIGWPKIAQHARSLNLDPEPICRELSHLFTPDVCLSLAQRGEPMLMASLFVAGVVPSTDRMLSLGLDLTRCDGWRAEPKLIKALRESDDHDAARFEVAVWAALRRAGLVVDYEHAETPGGKAADFDFLDGGLRVAVEAKTLLPSPAEANGHVIRDVVRQLAMTAGADGTGLTFHIHEELATRVADEKNTPRFEASVQEACSCALGWASDFDHDLGVGTHEVPGLGSLVVSAENAASMGWTIANLDEDTRERNVRRALRLVLQGADQVRDQKTADVRAVVVRTSPWRLSADTVARDLQAAFAEVKQSEVSRHRQLDAIVIANDPHERVHVSTFHWSRPEVQNMRWVQAISSLRSA